MRAAIYNRVSTDMQQQTGASLAAQESMNRAECARRGATSIEAFTDVQSAKDTNRPELTRLMEWVSARRLDLLCQ